MSNLSNMKLSKIQRKFLKNIVECGFNIMRCCEMTNISRATYYVWRKVNPDFNLAFDDLEERTVDHVESKLMELVNGVQIEKTLNDGSTEIYDTAPNVKAIEIFLKAKAKKRGYADKLEIEQKDTTVTIKREIVHSVYDPEKATNNAD